MLTHDAHGLAYPAVVQEEVALGGAHAEDVALGVPRHVRHLLHHLHVLQAHGLPLPDLVHHHRVPDAGLGARGEDGQLLAPPVPRQLHRRALTLRHLSRDLDLVVQVTLAIVHEEPELARRGGDELAVRGPRERHRAPAQPVGAHLEELLHPQEPLVADATLRMFVRHPTSFFVGATRAFHS